MHLNISNPIDVEIHLNVQLTVPAWNTFRLQSKIASDRLAYGFNNSQILEVLIVKEIVCDNSGHEHSIDCKRFTGRLDRDLWCGHFDIYC